MNHKLPKTRKEELNSSGFTILEVMIAVVIFSFLIVYVSQLMNIEIRLFNTASKQNELDHNSRAAMMHILDEIRLNPNSVKDEYDHEDTPPPVKRYYYSGDADGFNEGVYYVFFDPMTMSELTGCLINSNPRDLASLPNGPLIFLDKNNSELWYRDVDNNNKMISNQIKSISLSTESYTESVDRLLKIEITSLDNSKLLSWIRLY